MSTDGSNPKGDDGATTLHVVLHAPEIPWNTGNLGRTCVATGSQLHLIRPLGFSLDEKRVKRAGLDYWPHVDPRIWDSWDAFADALPELGEPWFFSAEGRRDFRQADLRGPTVLIFGSETSGLPRFIRERYPERLVSIPMHRGPVRSLNLSTAAAVAIFEAQRQRQPS